MTRKDAGGAPPALGLGFAAYTCWGLFPIYFKLLGHVPAMQVLGHRVAWSFVVLAIPALFVPGIWAPLRSRLPARVYAQGALAALLIAVNWFIYVYGVAAGFVVETSLGYFMTPLVNVLLGVVVLRESLRRLQWLAVGLATAGVAYLTWVYGAPPWIAVGLALSFGSYGLVKKQIPLPPLPGLALETAILFLPALFYLATLQGRGSGAFRQAGLGTDLLLAGTGVVTMIPLALFAVAVRRVPLATMGLLQYISPSIQFLLGVLVYREPFSRAQLTGFALVWAALVVFTAEGIATHRRLTALRQAAVGGIGDW